MTRRALVCLVGVAALAGCATGSGSDTTVTVSAASSLTEAFEVLADEFNDVHPDARVELTFGSSSSLATQIEEGAPADVFASADRQNMQRLVDAGVVSDPVALVRNRLTIAVKRGNPEGVRLLADLERLDVVALCAHDVPCGRLADRVLDGAGVELDARRVTRAPNAKATLTAVADGDATAAIVYVTDVAAAPDAVTGVEIPDERNVVTEYAIAVLDGAKPQGPARELVEFLTSARARSVFARFGFPAV